jgi:hypothetical protein
MWYSHIVLATHREITVCNPDVLSDLFDQVFGRRRSMIPTSLPGSDPVKESGRLVQLMLSCKDRNVDMTRFKQELSERTGYGDQIESWLEGTPPNAMVRSIVLAAAEDLAKLYKFALNVVPLQNAA